MSSADTWTARYRGLSTALLITDDAVVDVPIVKVLKRVVVVAGAFGDMRYATDVNNQHYSAGGCSFRDALRDTSGRVIHGDCPMLALEGDAFADTVRKGLAEAAVLKAKMQELRDRLDPLYADADLAALERVAIALDRSRVTVSATGEWCGLLGLIGGNVPTIEHYGGQSHWVSGVSLSRPQLAAVQSLTAQLRRKVAEAHRAGFAKGKDLLVGLNSGEYTPETFAKAVHHYQYRIDLDVERSQE